MQYQLRVIRDGEHPLNIKLNASDTVDARQQAEQKGFKVLKIKSSYASFLARKNQFPLILFCQEFRVLLEAGLSINDVLETLIEKEPNLSHKSTIQQLLGKVREGQTLSCLRVWYFSTAILISVCHSKVHPHLRNTS